MPSRVYWVEEPSILCAEYTGHVSSDDLESALTECLMTLENQPLYFLVDLTKASNFPTNVTKMGVVSRLIRHPNTKWFAVVGPSTYVNFLIQLLVRTRIKIFASYDEAVQFLRERVRIDTQENSQQ